MDESERLEAGLMRRRQVLGDEHVERAAGATTDFDRDFQSLLTRYAWGEIWTRPQLDERTRRLLVIAMTTALGREEELALHLRAALEHNVTQTELIETLLQTALYCGLPAANSAFRVAKSVVGTAKPRRSFVEGNGPRIAYRLDGPVDAPLLVLSHSLGCALEAWNAQVAAFASRFRVLRYDLRGHGESGVAEGPWGLEALGEDVLALLDALGVVRANFCGLSLGGMIGIWLGIHAPERIERLVLSTTAAFFGTPATWNERIARVSDGGMAAIAPIVIERWFTPDFVAAAPAAVHEIERLLLATPPDGYAAACAAIRDADLRSDLAALAPPSLIIAGKYDPVSPPQLGKDIASAARDARYLELETAHLANVERPRSFADAVLAFL